MSKRKLNDDLRGFGRLSDQALCDLVAKLKANPELLDDAPTNRWQIRRGDKRMMDQVSTTLDLENFQWVVAKPCETLRMFCEHSLGLSKLVSSTVSKTSGPLHAIIEYDEVTPGNVLAPENRRTFYCFYWSIREFGNAIKSVDTWFPLAVLRTKTLKEKESGMLSAAFAALLRLFTFQSDLARGVVIASATGPVLVVAEVGNNLADEAALKRSLDVKGSSGLLPCIKCKNVVKKKSGITANRKDEYFVDITCGDFERFDPLSDTDLYEHADALAALATASKKRRHEESMARGLNFHTRGVMFALDLRPHFKPVSSSRYDPMHLYFSNGVASYELKALMNMLKSVGISATLVQQWVAADFQFPHIFKGKGKSLHACVAADATKTSANKKRRRKCSELAPLRRSCSCH
jgi:hypothetical protein